MEIAWAVGAGAGLSLLAGFRAFIPVAVFMLLARLDWVWGFSVVDTPFDFMKSGAAVLALLGLVAVEVLMTRMPVLVGLEHILRLPLSVAAGALLMAAAMSGELADGRLYLIGLPAGALLALLNAYNHRGMMKAGEGRDPGLALDLSVLALAVLVMLAPPAGYLYVVLALWLAWRVRRLKRMKYKGLRVLA
ncbi:MAG: DUF4126 family protein [Actinomycetota bacterium]